ncbi:MAG TPA: YheC/YheD family protein [Bacilli bacterium]|nr:YheC/YheD family protein [Bacilli bacterium]
MRRKDIIHIGVRTDGVSTDTGRSSDGLPWYLSISETARREVQLPYHRKLRVRMSPTSDPIILPVEPHWRARFSTRDVLVPVRVNKNKHGIVLGPIVGILTVKRPGQASGFRGNKANFRDIVLAGKRLGVTVFVFTPDGLISDNRVKGYVLSGRTGSSGKRIWRRVVLPLPSVVYNRVPDREAEQTAAVRRAKKWLEERGIVLFNNGFFNKREVHEWLLGSEATARHLPHTEELRDERQIGRLLRRYPLLYVKPVDGKAGEGIIQIRHEGRGYRVVYQSGGKRTAMRYGSRKEAAQAAYRKAAGRSYLLQQGIFLANHDGRLFDLRVLLQKNRYGEWRVTGLGARIADRDGITTHVPNGGRIEKAYIALQGAFGQAKGRSVELRAREAALQMARRIEEEAKREGGEIGEMSMDIGVAADGELWFFEANAKPMKFDEPLIRKKSLLRLVQYCDYLARVK